MSFGGAKTTQTTQQQTNPWAPAQDGLKSIISGAQDWMSNAPNRQFYPGQTYAAMSDPTKAGMDQLASGGGANTNAAQGYFGDTLSGKYLSSGNPYFQDMANSITAGVMPGINATFSKSGMSGSDPHQYTLAKGLSDAISPYAYQNYSQGLDRMQNAAAAAPQLDAQTAQNKLGAGAIGEGYTQKSIDEAMARFNYEQNKPLEAMQQASGLINPIAGMGSQTSGTTTQQQQQSPLQTAVGLGLMGASMFGSGGMFPGALNGLGSKIGGYFGGGASPSMPSLTSSNYNGGWGYFGGGR